MAYVEEGGRKLREKMGGTLNERVRPHHPPRRVKAFRGLRIAHTLATAGSAGKAAGISPSASSCHPQVAAPVSSFARNMLEKMGWSEGEGLGKDKQGINTHIKAKKR